MDILPFFNQHLLFLAKRKLIDNVVYKFSTYAITEEKT